MTKIKQNLSTFNNKNNKDTNRNKNEDTIYALSTGVGTAVSVVISLNIDNKSRWKTCLSGTVTTK
jgi:hypothetical protein